MEYKGVCVSPVKLWSRSPSYRPEFWDIMQYLGVNTIRMVIGHEALGYTPTPDEFKKDILDKGEAYGIKGIFLPGGIVRNYYPLDIEGAKAALYSYVVDGGLVGDPRIVAWDVWNEPDLDEPGAIDWLREICGYLKYIDPTTPVTIGGWHKGSVYQSPRHLEAIIDFIDIVQCHFYQNPHIVDIYGMTKDYLNEIIKVSKGKLVIQGEWGLPVGAPVRYDTIFTEAEQKKYYEDSLRALFEVKEVIGSFPYIFTILPDYNSPIRDDLTIRPAGYTLKEWYTMPTPTPPNILPALLIGGGLLYLLTRRG